MTPPRSGYEMLLTVREVLDYDVFRRAGARVATCAESLDRAVRWAHNSEIPDIASFLRGGEILLTAGLGIGHASDEQRRYIDLLADSGASALVLELGRAFTTLPDAMASQATSRHLPIITLEREIRFMDVTERVQASVVSRQYEQLRKAERVGVELNASLLRGDSLEQILDQLADVLGNPLVLENSAHQVVAQARLPYDLSEVFGPSGWETHSRSGHGEADRATASVADQPGLPSCVWSPILLRGESVGRLHVIELNSRLGEIDYLSVDRAAAGIGIALLSERQDRHLTDEAHGALFADILQGRLTSTKAILSRARTLGTDLADACLVAVLAETTPRPPSREEPSQVTPRWLLGELRRASAVERCACFAAVQGRRVIGILGVPSGMRPLGAVVDGLGAALIAAVTQEASSENIFLGASEVSGISVRRALEQAGEALSYGRLTGTKGVSHFRDIGYYHLLLTLRDGPELAQYVESELGPLLQHDASKSNRLLPTLRAYLECGGSKSAASASLYLQRRSLYDRLKRIERILHCDLGDVETRVRLHVALRSLAIAQEDSGAGH
jgi:purine catabolism regulator